MPKLGPYEVHSFADKFPLIDGAKFENLVEDIKKNGLTDPITITHDKKILVDGRNRYRACEIAGVTPKIHVLGHYYTEEMILNYIVSKNLHRRDLTTGQRAFAAIEYEKHLAKENAKNVGGRPRKGEEKLPADRPEVSRRERESRERAAKIVGTSGRAVQKAKAIDKDAPDLVKKVQAGELSLEAAYTQVRQKSTTPKPKAKKVAPKKPTKRELEKQLKEQRDRVEDWVFKVETISSASPFRSTNFELKASITPEERQGWYDRLYTARTPITTAINKLDKTLKEGTP